jgi:hypothetical protein
MASTMGLSCWLRWQCRQLWWWLMASATMVSLPPAITTMTSILTLIALTLALSWTRIGRWGGGRAMMHLICHCHSSCCWCHLCLQSWDNSAKDDGCGNTRGRNPGIHSRAEVGHHDPIGSEQQKQQLKLNKINNSGGNVTASMPADSYTRAATAATFA